MAGQLCQRKIKETLANNGAYKGERVPLCRIGYIDGSLYVTSESQFTRPNPEVPCCLRSTCIEGEHLCPLHVQLLTNQGYESLRTRAGYLQRDISTGNLIIRDQEDHSTWSAFLTWHVMAAKYDGGDCVLAGEPTA
jgi:hypothetical protein